MQKADLLVRIFGEVVIPETVRVGLLRSHPEPPPWLRVQPVNDPTRALLYAKTVDRGEAEAIALAWELKADYLLMDERKGRRLAREQGLPVIGLLGVVLIAKRSGFIASERNLLLELDQQAGVYLGEKLREDALKTVGE